MTVAFNASLYSRLQLLEHENLAQNRAISRLQLQSERLSLAVARLLPKKSVGDEAANKSIAEADVTRHNRHSTAASSGNDNYFWKESTSQRTAWRDSSQSLTRSLSSQAPSTPRISTAYEKAMKTSASFATVSAACPHGPACRKEFCDLAHSAFFCCAHGLHCMQPAACGIMSLSKARRLYKAHLHAPPPAATGADAGADDQLFCVWMHAHCDKFQPRSAHLCASGFREVRVLSDARRPQTCRSWSLIRNVRCFNSRENRGNGFSTQLLRRAVERQLPGVLLNVAADSFMFTSAASAMEALQLMISDTDSPASMIHVI